VIYNGGVAKKRRTKQQKIILQLKRQLAQKQTPQTTFAEPRQGAISGSVEPESKPLKKPKLPFKKADEPIFSSDPRLIKKDLAKTLILTLAVISLEIVLYWKLR